MPLVHPTTGAEARMKARSVWSVLGSVERLRAPGSLPSSVTPSSKNLNLAAQQTRPISMASLRGFLLDVSVLCGSKPGCVRAPGFRRTDCVFYF